MGISSWIFGWWHFRQMKFSSEWRHDWNARRIPNEEFAERVETWRATQTGQVLSSFDLLQDLDVKNAINIQLCLSWWAGEHEATSFYVWRHKIITKWLKFNHSHWGAIVCVRVCDREKEGQGGREREKQIDYIVSVWIISYFLPLVAAIE